MAIPSGLNGLPPPYGARPRPQVPAAEPKPSRWQMIFAYTVMMKETIAKIGLLMLSIFATGWWMSSWITAPPVAALAGVGVLAPLMLTSAAFTLAFAGLIIWIIPTENDNPFG